MSMLSAQRDKLRAIADRLFNMDCHDYASEVRDAADTIWQLRNDCVDLRLENKKLCELCVDLYLCSDETCTDCEYRDYSGEGFWCKRGIGWKRVRMRELGIEVKP